MKRMALASGLVTALCLIPHFTQAQTTPGNIAVITGTALLEISPSGPITTIAQVPAGQRAIGICPTIDNRGVALLTQAVSLNLTTIRVLEVKNGQVTTLAWTRKTTLGTLFPVLQGGIVPEQRGDYIIASPLGVHRVHGIGRNLLTLHTLTPTGLCDNLVPGGWLTFTNNAVAALTRSGAKTQVARIGGMIPIGRGSMATDTTTGNAFVAQGALYAVDLVRKKISTLASGAPLGFVLSVDIDPGDRSLIVGTSTHVFRTDRQGRVLGTLAANIKAVGVAVIGSNHLAGYSLPTPGSKYSLFVSFPHPNLAYELGASFGFFPGIPTPSGILPLNADNLLFLSREVPAMFIDFSGRLDSGGHAFAGVAIPKAPLHGVRFYLAALDHDSGGKIRIISEPMGVTLE